MNEVLAQNWLWIVLFNIITVILWVAPWAAIVIRDNYRLQSDNKWIAFPLPCLWARMVKKCGGEELAQWEVHSMWGAAIIGWIFFAAAILMMLSSIMAFLAFASMSSMGRGAHSIPEDAPKVFAFIFRYFGIFAAIQLLLAIFILIASIEFLKLRAWARTALEVVSWLGLIYVISFGIFWVFNWVSMTAGTPASGQSGSGPPPVFRMLGMAMGIFVTLFWAAPPVVLIIFLRSAAVRNAFKTE